MKQNKADRQQGRVEERKKSWIWLQGLWLPKLYSVLLDNINLSGPCCHQMENKRVYPEWSSRLPVAYKNICFVDATDVLLMSFLSEDLIVPPHELLKCGIS